MVNKIHERVLRLRLNDNASDFDTLLQNNNDTSNHIRNIPSLVFEIYKIKNNLNSPNMGFMFERRNIFEIFKIWRQKEKELKKWVLKL